MPRGLLPLMGPDANGQENAELNGSILLHSSHHLFFHFFPKIELTLPADPPSSIVFAFGAARGPMAFLLLNNLSSMAPTSMMAK